MNLVKRFRNEPLSSRPMQLERFEDRTWMKLEPGQWQAFPCPSTIANSHTAWKWSRHCVESGAEHERLLGVSIIEPDGPTWERILQSDFGFRAQATSWSRSDS
ncbi:MAG: hypothetical protein R3B96_07210 [Pirellulaceae bacterium]